MLWSARRVHGMASSASRDWPALVAWVVGSAIVDIAAASVRRNPFASSTWAHWDSLLYLSQATHGTTLFRCAGKASDWCGNAGWFPGFPWLIDGLRFLGVPAVSAGLAISWCFCLATIVLLWRTFLERRLNQANFGVLLYAAVAPGVAYRYGVHPISMLCFFVLASLWLLSSERIVLAGLAGAAAACTYPAAVALIPVSAVWLLVSAPHLPLAQRVRRAAATSGLIALGALFVLVTQWLQVRHLNAYFLVQAKYDHAAREPFATFLHALHFGNTTELETVLLTLTLATALLALLHDRTRTTRAEALIALWAIATWLVVSIPANVASYREDAIFLPIAPLLRRLPPAMIATIALLAAFLAVPMTIYYVRGQLQ